MMADRPSVSEERVDSYKQILRSSSIIGGAALVNVAIGLLRMKAVALLLGPAGVGLIGILQNIMATVSTVSALGFDNVGTRQIAKAAGCGDYRDIDAARRALFWGTMILAAFGGLALWALRNLIADRILDDESLGKTIGWLGLGVALSVAAGSQRALLNGMRRIGDIARVSVLSSLASTVLGIPLLVWMGEDALLLFILLAPLATFVISHFFVAQLAPVRSSSTPFRVLAGQWRVLAKLGSAFMLAGLAGSVGQLLVRSLVQNELGSEELGYFQAAWVISMTYIGFVLTAMGTDYYPRLTAAVANHGEANRLVNEQTEVAVLLAGPILLGMLALAPWIIQLLYSAEFRPAAAVLRWQIMGDVLKIASWPLGFIILAAGDGRTFVLTESIVMIIFAATTWLLLPATGILATGISFFLMYAVYLPVVYWLAWRRTGFHWSRRAVRDLSLILVSAGTVSILGAWHERLAAVIGLFAATAFGVAATIRLAAAAELDGPFVRIASAVRRLLVKAGVVHG